MSLGTVKFKMTSISLSFNNSLTDKYLIPYFFAHFLAATKLISAHLIILKLLKYL